MAEDSGPEFVQERVSADETPKAEKGDTESKPLVVDLDTLKAKAREAATVEARLKCARPFPLPPLGIEVMVAPVRGEEFFDKIFEMTTDFYRSPQGEWKIDRAFIKLVVANCVVAPPLDEEAINLLIEVDASLFSALAQFCMTVSLADNVAKIAERLGNLDTEAQELFFAGMRGSLSTLTPV